LQLLHFYPSSLSRSFELTIYISGPLQIFANAFPFHYSPPTGFHFEVNDDFVPVQVLMFHKNCFCQVFSERFIFLLSV
jgi:hypothetical protein